MADCCVSPGCPSWFACSVHVPERQTGLRICIFAWQHGGKVRRKVRLSAPGRGSDRCLDRLCECIGNVYGNCLDGERGLLRRVDIRLRRFRAEEIDVAWLVHL